MIENDIKSSIRNHMDDFNYFLSENSQITNSSVSDAKLYPKSQSTYLLSGLVFKPENYFDVTCYHQLLVT